MQYCVGAAVLDSAIAVDQLLIANNTASLDFSSLCDPDAVLSCPHVHFELHQSMLDCVDGVVESPV